MRKTRISSLLLIFILFSCGPLVKTRVRSTIPIQTTEGNIKVFGLYENSPTDSEVLGSVKVGDTGFSTNCDYLTVLEKAKNEARKVGGNAIKITKYIPPGKSTCHRITAQIIRIHTTSNTTLKTIENVNNNSQAILNIYSDSDLPIMYNLIMEEKVLCRITKDFRTTIFIETEGLHLLKAGENRESEIQVDFKFGQVYYLWCYATKADSVYNSKIQIVSNDIGSQYFDIFSKKK